MRLAQIYGALFCLALPAAGFAGGEPAAITVEACAAQACAPGTAVASTAVEPAGDIWQQCRIFAEALLRQEQLAAITELGIGDTAYAIDADIEHPVEGFAGQCETIVRQHLGLPPRL